MTVNGEVVGQIGPGLLALLGIHQDDHQGQIPWMVRKLCGLRIFQDEQGKMNLSVQDIRGEILVVSQFTLYGDCMSGRRPSFIEALSGPEAEVFYDKFVEEVREALGSVQTGVFGASMQVSLVNDGPVTLLVDDRRNAKF